MATATTTPKGKALLAKVILALLALGVLSYAYLPEAHCGLEDKTVKYVYMSDSHKTVTKVLPSSDEGGYSIVDDRCQKGRVIGEWVPVNEALTKQCPVRIIAYTDNGKYYCNEEGSCVNNKLETTNLEVS